MHDEAQRRPFSAFRVVGMDDPGEGTLVRMALEGHAAAATLDLVARTVTVWHHSPTDDIEARIAELGMGAGVWPAGRRRTTCPGKWQLLNPAAGARALLWLLAINAVMCVIEGLTNWWADRRPAGR